MDFDKCSTSCEDKLIAVKENKKKFTIQNDNNRLVRTVTVDNCLITGTSKRCDYLFEIGQAIELAIYLELKGKDINHASQQLAATLEALKERHASSEKLCQIVSSRVPKSGTNIQVLKLKFRKTYNAKLLFDTREKKFLLG